MKQIITKHKQKRSFRNKILALFFLTMVVSPAAVCVASGNLYLVGLGPGDPDLATVKALKLVRDADLIYTFGGDIYERFAAYLKDKDVRELPSGIFTRYNMRKAKYNSSDQGDEKMARMAKERQSLFGDVRKAVKEGKKVVFIDSGDPLIYGPWVWMLEEFEDLDPEVVPGISSFNAGLAALKRDGTWAPNTHSVILTTDRPQSQDRLEALAAHQCSMVIFTHRTRFEDIIRKLKTHYDRETPIAVVIYAGFKDKESVIRGNLETIESLIKPETLPLEHIIFVGGFLTFDFEKN
jgi:precorrin-4/cobalt-precorrin-4 C11-methyltransferase